VAENGANSAREVLTGIGGLGMAILTATSVAGPAAGILTALRRLPALLLAAVIVAAQRRGLRGPRPTPAEPS